MQRALSFHPAGLTLACLLALQVLADGVPPTLPAGPTLVAGQAQFGAAGVVQGSDKAIIDWRQFNIGAGQQFTFQQPGSQSVVLNRVTGGDASTILGSLQANGRVFLVNPYGIYFGAGATVDVNGLLASTLDISNDDFLAGRYRFFGKGNAASVVNQGSLHAANGGFVALLGDRVDNSGKITAQLGSVLLASGRQMQLDFNGDGLIGYSIGDTAMGEGGIANSGLIQADGGKVVLSARTARQLTAAAVNNSGIIQARSVAQHDGVVELLGAGADVRNGGTVDVSGDQGGHIRLDSDSHTTVSGNLLATGRSAGGGDIGIYGQAIGVATTGKLDASGSTGGGDIRIGGDWQGSGANRLASTAYIAAGAALSANATQTGDGGKVVVWSQDQTRFDGQIAARGGAQGGNGGKVEVSGKQHLTFNGQVDTSAAKGSLGQLLLDPSSILITKTAANNTDGLDPLVSNSDGTINAGDANGSASNILSQAAIEAAAASNNVLLQSTGQITIDSNLANNTLNLNRPAGGSVQLISTTSGGINFKDHNTTLTAGSGNLTLQAGGSGTLSDIGKLVGGNITLESDGSGTSSFYNMVDAGSGLLTLTLNGGKIIGDSMSVKAGSVVLRGNGAVTIGGGTGNTTLAADFNGAVWYTTTGNLTLGTVDGVSGVNTHGNNARLGGSSLAINQTLNVAGANALLITNGGSLTQTAPIQANGIELWNNTSARDNSTTITLNNAGNTFKKVGGLLNNGSLNITTTGGLEIGQVDTTILGNNFTFGTGNIGGLELDYGNLTINTSAPSVAGGNDYTKQQTSPFTSGSVNPAGLYLSGLVNLTGTGSVGQVTLNVNGGVLQQSTDANGNTTNKGAIQASRLLVNGSGTGNIELTNVYNKVDTIAGRANGSFSFSGGANANSSLVIGTVSGVSGIVTTSNTVVKPAVYTNGQLSQQALYNSNDISISASSSLDINTQLNSSNTHSQGGTTTIGLGGDFTAKTGSGITIQANNLGVLGQNGQGTFILKSNVSGLFAGGGKYMWIDNSAYTGLLSAFGIGAVSDAQSVPTVDGNGNQGSQAVDAVNRPVGDFYLTTGDDLRIIRLKSTGNNIMLRANNVAVVLDVSVKDNERVLLAPYSDNRQIDLRQAYFGGTASTGYQTGVTGNTTYTWELLKKFLNGTTFYIGALPYAMRQDAFVASLLSQGFSFPQSSMGINVGQDGVAGIDLGLRSLSVQSLGDVHVYNTPSVYNLRMFGENVIADAFNVTGDQLHIISNTLSMPSSSNTWYQTGANTQIVLRNTTDQTIWLGTRPGSAASGSETQYSGDLLTKFRDGSTIIISGTTDMKFKGGAIKIVNPAYGDIHLNQDGAMGNLGNRKLILDTTQSITNDNWSVGHISSQGNTGTAGGLWGGFYDTSGCAIGDAACAGSKGGGAGGNNNNNGNGNSGGNGSGSNNSGNSGCNASSCSNNSGNSGNSAGANTGSGSNSTGNAGNTGNNSGNNGSGNSGNGNGNNTGNGGTGNSGNGNGTGSSGSGNTGTGNGSNGGGTGNTGSGSNGGGAGSAGSGNGSGGSGNGSGNSGTGNGSTGSGSGSGGTGNGTGGSGTGGTGTGNGSGGTGTGGSGSGNGSAGGGTGGSGAGAGDAGSGNSGGGAGAGNGGAGTGSGGAGSGGSGSGNGGSGAGAGNGGSGNGTGGSSAGGSGDGAGSSGSGEGGSGSGSGGAGSGSGNTGTGSGGSGNGNGAGGSGDGSSGNGNGGTGAGSGGSGDGNGSGGAGSGNSGNGSGGAGSGDGGNGAGNGGSGNGSGAGGNGNGQGDQGNGAGNGGSGDGNGSGGAGSGTDQGGDGKGGGGNGDGNHGTSGGHSRGADADANGSGGAGSGEGNGAGTGGEGGGGRGGNAGSADTSHDGIPCDDMPLNHRIVDEKDAGSIDLSQGEGLIKVQGDGVNMRRDCKRTGKAGPSAMDPGKPRLARGSSSAE